MFVCACVRVCVCVCPAVCACVQVFAGGATHKKSKPPGSEPPRSDNTDRGRDQTRPRPRLTLLQFVGAPLQHPQPAAALPAVHGAHVERGGARGVDVGDDLGG